MKAKKLVLPKHQVLCREGDTAKDIYLVRKGKLLICSRSGNRVTPIAHIGEGEYFGEMSFFDQKNRSADVITLEETELLHIPLQDITNQFPKWLLITTRAMTKKLRLIDEVIRDQGIKRQNVQSIKPLTLEEQRQFFELL